MACARGKPAQVLRASRPPPTPDPDERREAHPVSPRPASGEPPRPKTRGCVELFNSVCGGGVGGTGRQSAAGSTRSGHGATAQASTQTRGEGTARKAQGLELSPPHPTPTRSHPEIRVKNMVKMPTGAAGSTRTRRPRPSGEAGPTEATPGTHLCPGGKPVAKKNVHGDYGTYIRFSPTLGEKGGASTRHHFPSLPRAASTRHQFNLHPLPQRLGDRRRCTLSPQTSAGRPAHAPLDPEEDESGSVGGGDERSLGSRVVGVYRRSLGFPGQRRVVLFPAALRAETLENRRDLEPQSELGLDGGPKPLLGVEPTSVLRVDAERGGKRVARQPRAAQGAPACTRGRARASRALRHLWPILST
ncbi:hypothetical protein R6Z07F_008857 [Ovis aries]